MDRKMDTIRILKRKTGETRPLDPVPKLSNNKHKEDHAGVVELADTLDSKSKVALLEKLLRELKRKIQ